MLTAERLRSILHYAPETGVFTWLVNSGSRSIGMQVGVAIGKHRGNRVNINKTAYRCSRLAWLYMTGEWPAHEIDHMDCNHFNDKWDNLRLATRQQNAANRRIHSNNKSGWKRVYKKRNGLRYSQIHVNGHGTTLGTFDCPAAAYFAYLIAADKAFGEFARGG